MRRAPSLQNLESAFPQIDRDALKNVRRAIHQGKGINVIDKILENHGVEYVNNKHGHVIASYSNSGDTYAPTILFVWSNHAYRLTTLGDFVENYEKRHGRLP